MRYRTILREKFRAQKLPTPRPISTPHGASLLAAHGDILEINKAPNKIFDWLSTQGDPRCPPPVDPTPKATIEVIR